MGTRRSRPRFRPVVLFLALAAALAVLWSCGEYSLFDTLELEESAEPIEIGDGGPGSDTYLPVNWPITLSVSGGVEPYSYSAEPAEGKVAGDQDSVTYTAPDAISGDLKEITVIVTDALGKRATVKVKVHNPLEVAPPAFTLATGETREITLSGGVMPYSYTYTGVGSVAPLANPHKFLYTAPSTPGSETIEFKDATDTALNTQSVVVTITGIGALALDPATAVIHVGQSASFLVTGGSGSYTISQNPSGPGDGSTAPLTANDGDTVTYTAPPSLAIDLNVTITVDDGGSTADFDVTVLAPPATPLAVSFNPPPTGNKIKIEPGGTIDVTAAGGKPPYTFAVPQRPVAIAPATAATDPATATYTALTGNSKKVSETIVVSDSASPPAVESITVEIQKP
jgi:hypothetical protein